MLGRTNATIPPFDTLNELEYSYDGTTWRPFSSTGADIAGCASLNLTSNILTIKQSGYYYLNNTATDANIRYIRYGATAASYSSEETYQRDPNVYFYLRPKTSVYINLCAVGGGGCGGGSNGNTGGGGGAGGQVAYNKVPILFTNKDIFKIQIGDRSRGAASGQATTIYRENSLTGTADTLVTCVGGAAASTNTPGAGAATTFANGFYFRQASGGKTTAKYGVAGSDGTYWPINRTAYGGGGGSGGIKEGGQWSGSYQLMNYYTGGNGGVGGGGKGDWLSYSQNASSAPSTSGNCVNFFGGGGGGAGGGRGAAYHLGGSGICLINFI